MATMQDVPSDERMARTSSNERLSGDVSPDASGLQGVSNLGEISTSDQLPYEISSKTESCGSSRCLLSPGTASALERESFVRASSSPQASPSHAAPDSKAQTLNDRVSLLRPSDNDVGLAAEASELPVVDSPRVAASGADWRQAVRQHRRDASNRRRPRVHGHVHLSPVRSVSSCAAMHTGRNTPDGGSACSDAGDLQQVSARGHSPVGVGFGAGAGAGSISDEGAAVCSSHEPAGLWASCAGLADAGGSMSSNSAATQSDLASALGRNVASLLDGQSDEMIQHASSTPIRSQAQVSRGAALRLLGERNRLAPTPQAARRSGLPPTAPFGALRFRGIQAAPARWAAVSRCANAADVAALLNDTWQIPKPEVIISITGAASGDFPGWPSVAKDIFERGLSNALRATKAWIVSGGTNGGVMQLVGRANMVLQQYGGDERGPATYQRRGICLGIATWGVLVNQNELQRSVGRVRKVGGREMNAQLARMHPDGARTVLDPGHSHFILVDGGAEAHGKFGQEIELRATLEDHFCHAPRNPEELQCAALCPVWAVVKRTPRHAAPRRARPGRAAVLLAACCRLRLLVARLLVTPPYPTVGYVHCLPAPRSGDRGGWRPCSCLGGVVA